MNCTNDIITTGNIIEDKQKSTYHQLSSILNILKPEEITINRVINKIQLKDTLPNKPYCKITHEGSVALYGITKHPLILYTEQWNRLLKLNKNNYIENYITINKSKLKFKNPRTPFNNKNIFPKLSQFINKI